MCQNKNTDNRIVNNSEAVAAIVEVCAKFGVNKFNISTKKDNDIKVRLGVQAGKVGNIGIDVEVNNNCELQTVAAQVGIRRSHQHDIC